MATNSDFLIRAGSLPLARPRTKTKTYASWQLGYSINEPVFVITCVAVGGGNGNGGGVGGVFIALSGYPCILLAGGFMSPYRTAVVTPVNEKKKRRDRSGLMRFLMYIFFMVVRKNKIQVGHHRLVCGTPAPKDCELYYVDKDALFSYHTLSEVR